MNILLLNWRDPKNPKSGGAEKLNMHILTPLLKRGDTVTWYAMASNGLKNEEIIDGVKVIRFGNVFTHFLAFPFFLLIRKFGKVDFCIDSIHGIGYQSNIFMPMTKKVILICEVAQDIWNDMYAFPVYYIGRIWEKIMFYLYRHLEFWTISQSTKNDLIHFGISEKNIYILPMGFDGFRLNYLPKTYATASALFVGRLAKMKGIEDAMKAIAEIKKINIIWSLRIIGKGTKEYEAHLRRVVKRLKITEQISFLGFVSEREKFEEMAKAWVLLVPSRREGWGMIVPEANSVGTQVLGYNVPGLSDALRRYSRKNILVKAQDSEDLATKLKKIISPLKVVPKIPAGWNELYEFVEKKI